MPLTPLHSSGIRPAASSLPLITKRNETQPAARPHALSGRHVIWRNAGAVCSRADVSQQEVLVGLLEQQA